MPKWKGLAWIFGRPPGCIPVVLALARATGFATHSCPSPFPFPTAFSPPLPFSCLAPNPSTTTTTTTTTTQPQVVSRAPLAPAELAAMQLLVDDDATYYVRVAFTAVSAAFKEATSSGASASAPSASAPRYAMGSTPARCLAASRFRERWVLHVVEDGSVRGLEYWTSIGLGCPGLGAAADDLTAGPGAGLDAPEGPLDPEDAVFSSVAVLKYPRPAAHAALESYKARVDKEAIAAAARQGQGGGGGGHGTGGQGGSGGSGVRTAAGQGSAGARTEGQGARRPRRVSPSRGTSATRSTSWSASTWWSRS